MIIKLNVRHNYLKHRFIEIRFDSELPIKDVKTKIYTMTGTPQRSQKLILKRGEGDLVVLTDKLTLHDYNAQDGMELDVYDQNQYSVVRDIGSKELPPVPQVSDEQYFKCKNNVVYQIQQKMQDPEYQQLILSQQQQRELATQQELQNDVHLNQIVFVNNQEALVKFIGTVHFGAGLFYGVEVPFGSGCTNGTEGGVIYFSCPENSGMFLKFGDFQIQKEDEKEDEDEL
ncbi:Tubulin_specific chaperone B [Hexamita inflata]|uniref:Tubulin specific chaperone B n=1 Tax=Hexamita inflata TaxID=28002 RepID=A0AA86R6U2_9EUKA|nr:Tubulin specific chaperone B [Hexamita inflata]